MPLRVLLVDDNPEQSDLWAEEMTAASDPSRYSIGQVSAEDFGREITLLSDRRRRVLEGTFPANDTALFDECDILVVDYDLTFFDGTGYQTGEHVAYLARCFSTCGLIILLNQFDADVDLTMRGHSESYADVNIAGRLVGNPNFWSDRVNPSRFSPWWITDFGSATARLADRCRLVESELDSRILETLGLGAEHYRIPLDVLGFLAAGPIEPQDVSFLQFVEHSSHGMRCNGHSDARWAARVAAARTGTWVEQSLLPLQDVIVDGPHILAREGLEPERPHGGDFMSAELRNSLAAAAFDREAWTFGRPAWYWSGAVEVLDEIDVPSRATGDDRSRFCEDLSRFVSEEHVRSFVTSLPTPYDRRFVFNPSRPNMAEVFGAELVDEMNSLQYLPAVRFAL